jgi:hypothetical protein
VLKHMSRNMEARVSETATENKHKVRVTLENG